MHSHVRSQCSEMCIKAIIFFSILDHPLVVPKRQKIVTNELGESSSSLYSCLMQSLFDMHKTCIQPCGNLNVCTIESMVL